MVIRDSLSVKQKIYKVNKRWTNSVQPETLRFYCG